MEKKRYDAIDGLRMIACIGIVMMHVRANNTYALSGFAYDKIIASFTNFVYLFMVISAFGMCSGYLDKILNNQISLETFYIKRYNRILPFFSILVLLDIAISPSKDAWMEGFADVTLLFGLFPNDISVIGVGWFLGLIFAFYMIFPFYCVLLKSKKRAWGALVISLALNYVCGAYFELGRKNIVYSLCYLLAGGLVYLYRNKLDQFSKRYWWMSFGLVFLAVVLYYGIGANTITMLFVSTMLLIYALGRTGGILQNKLTKFFSSVSMEIYLSHMVMFRVIEKIGLNKVVGNGWIQYAITVMLTLCGAVGFSLILKKGIEVGGRVIYRKVAER